MTLALVVLAGWIGGGPRAGAATVTVVMGDYFFNPTNVSVFQGDTIVWTNRSLLRTHDTTQGAAATPDTQRLWKSASLSANTGNYRFTFTNAGFYPYICLQHIATFPQQTGTVTVVGGNLPPSVSLTGPAGGSRHPAPPNFPATATASDPDGQVTNVFFTATATGLGTVVIGSDATAPYSVAVTNLPPASYQFRAIATDDGGVSTTSSVVNVLIATPVPLVLSSPRLTNGTAFEFDLATTLGLSYVVEESTNPAGPWLGVSTNSGTSTGVKISRPFSPASPGPRVYRAFIQP